jgi:hypothetical protein
MSISVLPAGSVRPAPAPRPVPAPAILPEIGPGQLWLIELSATQGEPSALRRAIERANVVIYDRVFADAVARALPLGGYAEPAASADETGDPAAARAVRFACDGWSVVRLLPSRPRTWPAGGLRCSSTPTRRTICKDF